MNKIICLITFIIFLTLPAGAFALELFTWKESPDSASVIMPLKTNQTKKEAINEYYSKIKEASSLDELRKQSEILDFVLEDGSIAHNEGIFGKAPSPLKNGKKARFILVTNELRDLYAPPRGARVANIIKRLEKLGGEVWILPVVHDLALNAREAKEFREKIINLFDAQLIMGGADIDPYLYGEKTTFAKSVVRRRDVSELKFVRQFIQAKKGMNFGICRGHQMCAVANHKKLFQDIQIEQEASDVHLNDFHEIEINKESEVFSVFDSDKILVNSLHHQAVVLKKNDPDYTIIAMSTDKKPIIEGLEFKNGLGVTLQFHPEYMHDETGERILKQFIKLTLLNKISQNSQKNCYGILKEFF